MGLEGGLVQIAVLLFQTGLHYCGVGQLASVMATVETGEKARRRLLGERKAGKMNHNSKQLEMHDVTYLLCHEVIDLMINRERIHPGDK